VPCGEEVRAKGWCSSKNGELGKKIHKSHLDKAAWLDRIVRKGTKRSQAET